jgi:hypothetical protein
MGSDNIIDLDTITPMSVHQKLCAAGIMMGEMSPAEAWANDLSALLDFRVDHISVTDEHIEITTTHMLPLAVLETLTHTLLRRKGTLYTLQDMRPTVMAGTKQPAFCIGFSKDWNV